MSHAAAHQLPTTLENFRQSGYEAAREAGRDYYAEYHLPAPMAMALGVIGGGMEPG